MRQPEAARDLTHGKLVHWISEWAAAFTLFQQLIPAVMASRHPIFTYDQLSVLQAVLAQVFDAYVLLRANLTYTENQHPADH